MKNIKEIFTPSERMQLQAIVNHALMSLRYAALLIFFCAL